MLILVRFEVSTAVTMMIIIFWEMTPCGSYENHTASSQKMIIIMLILALGLLLLLLYRCFPQELHGAEYSCRT
jgi:hypothetical protein